MHFANVIGRLSDNQIYMELENMKWKEIEKVEVHYEQIQKLAHGL